MSCARALTTTGLLVLTLGAGAACGTGHPQAAAPGAAGETATPFGRFADEYFDSLFAFAPSAATPQGSISTTRAWKT
jgi:hypothetical protein